MIGSADGLDGRSERPVDPEDRSPRCPGCGERGRDNCQCPPRCRTCGADAPDGWQCALCQATADVRDQRAWIRGCRQSLDGFRVDRAAAAAALADAEQKVSSWSSALAVGETRLADLEARLARLEETR